jgi:hypothetical protein
VCGVACSRARHLAWGLWRCGMERLRRTGVWDVGWPSLALVRGLLAFLCVCAGVALDRLVLYAAWGGLYMALLAFALTVVCLGPNYAWQLCLVG